MITMSYDRAMDRHFGLRGGEGGEEKGATKRSEETRQEGTDGLTGSLLTFSRKKGPVTLLYLPLGVVSALSLFNQRNGPWFFTDP